VNELNYFDSFVTVGNPRIAQRAGIYEMDQILAELRYYHITEALIHHRFSYEDDPPVGNDEVLKVTSGKDNLHPVWVLLPEHTNEMPPPEELVSLMLDRGVKAASVYPKTHNWSLAEWSAGSLLRALEAHRFPLLIHLDETTWEELHSLAQRHPALPLIVIGATYKTSRFIFPLFKRHPNLYLEIAGYQVHGGLGSLVAQIVAHDRPVPMAFVGMQDRYGISGRWDQLLEYFHLTPAAIVEAARDVISRKSA